MSDMIKLSTRYTANARRVDRLHPLAMFAAIVRDQKPPERSGRAINQ